MTILSKGHKPDNFEPHNSLKLGFLNIQGLHSSFVECEFFLESNSPDIFALSETNLDDSIDFSVRGYPYFAPPPPPLPPGHGGKGGGG